MGVKYQQGICPTHGKVLAVKNTHRIRNSVGVVATAGLSAKVEGYLCPVCGSPAPTAAGRFDKLVVQREKARERNRRLYGWIPGVGRLFS